MNPRHAHQSDWSSCICRPQAAFTLAELMIAMTIFLLVVGAVVATNFFGIRMVQVTQPKLEASAEVRRMMNLLVADITSAKIVRIGSGDLSSFTRVADGTVKQGNALQIYPSTDTNVFIRYFLDTTDQKLKRMTNGAASAVVIANALTNNLVFNGEDAFGNILTNNQNNMVVGLTLQYFQMEGSGTPIGPSNLFKSYQLRTRITHRPR